MIRPLFPTLSQINPFPPTPPRAEIAAGEEGSQIWKAAAETQNTSSRTLDNAWQSSLLVERGRPTNSFLT